MGPTCLISPNHPSKVYGIVYYSASYAASDVDTHLAAQPLSRRHSFHGNQYMLFQFSTSTESHDRTIDRLVVCAAWKGTGARLLQEEYASYPEKLVLYATVSVYSRGEVCRQTPGQQPGRRPASSKGETPKLCFISVISTLAFERIVALATLLIRAATCA